MKEVPGPPLQAVPSDHQRLVGVADDRAHGDQFLIASVGNHGTLDEAAHVAAHAAAHVAAHAAAPASPRLFTARFTELARHRKSREGKGGDGTRKPEPLRARRPGERRQHEDRGKRRRHEGHQREPVGVLGREKRAGEKHGAHGETDAERAIARDERTVERGARERKERDGIDEHRVGALAHRRSARPTRSTQSHAARSPAHRSTHRSTHRRTHRSTHRPTHRSPAARCTVTCEELPRRVEKVIRAIGREDRDDRKRKRRRDRESDGAKRELLDRDATRQHEPRDGRRAEHHRRRAESADMREGAQAREERERPESRDQSARRRHHGGAMQRPCSTRQEHERHRVLLEVAEHAERGGVGDRRGRHPRADHEARRASVAPRVRKQHDRHRDERRHHAVDPARREEQRIAQFHAAHERDQLANDRVHDEEERHIVVHRSAMLEQPPRLHRVVAGVHRGRDLGGEVELGAHRDPERRDREGGRHGPAGADARAVSRGRAIA